MPIVALKKFFLYLSIHFFSSLTTDTVMLCEKNLIWEPSIDSYFFDFTISYILGTIQKWRHRWNCITENTIRSDPRPILSCHFNFDQIAHTPFLGFIIGMVIECWICNFSFGNLVEHVRVTGNPNLPRFLYICIGNGLKYRFFDNLV